MDSARVLRGLLSGGWLHANFESFREGIEVSWIFRGEDDGASCALLRYGPGASVPRHRHDGLEIILVLDGSQSDEKGTYTAGDTVVNEPGSEHSVRSDDGCVVFIVWERSVVFVETT